MNNLSILLLDTERIVGQHAETAADNNHKSRPEGITEILMPWKPFFCSSIKNIKMFSSYLTDRVKPIIFMV